MQEKSMSPKEFFRKTGVKKYVFALNARLPSNVLKETVQGRMPSLEVAKMIVDQSKGLISYESIFESCVKKYQHD